MEPTHPTYRQLLNEIPKINHYFKVDFLTLSEEKFKLVKFSKKISLNSPLLVLMAGCHGEEPAPTLAIFKNYKLISETAKKYRVNLVIYPLMNPWGFDRNKRLNRRGLNCNSHWIHKKDKGVANEIKIVSKDIRDKKIKPLLFANLHEDDEIEKEFYIFSFGKRVYEKPLIQIGRKHFPILKDGMVSDATFKKAVVRALKGVVYNDHDGSAEDFMSHRGCKFSCCTETPSSQSLSKRIKCNTDLILKFIELTKKEKLEKELAAKANSS